ncbi:MAG TPA: hypothetical protein VIF88_16015 [Methylocystis sp.]|jgi:hypothetical protein
MKTRLAIIGSLALAFLAPAALAEDQQQEQQLQPQQESDQQSQQEQGVTSGPAAGTPVEPSGSVQKDNPKAVDAPSGVSGPSGTSAGAPAVEGKKGTQSGQEWAPPEEIRRKKGPSS